jgi:hypothetical protein
MSDSLQYTAGTVEVTTESALIVDTFAPKSQPWLIHNAGPETVYLGGENVTADMKSLSGFPLPADRWLPVPAYLQSTELYGITAKGKAYVSYLSPH